MLLFLLHRARPDGTDCALSINTAQVDIVTHYIENQVENHRKRDFKSEFRAFLQNTR